MSAKKKSRDWSPMDAHAQRALSGITHLTGVVSLPVTDAPAGLQKMPSPIGYFVSSSPATHVLDGAVTLGAAAIMQRVDGATTKNYGVFIGTNANGPCFYQFKDFAKDLHWVTGTRSVSPEQIFLHQSFCNRTTT